MPDYKHECWGFRLKTTSTSLTGPSPLPQQSVVLFNCLVMPASKDTGKQISEPSGVIEHSVYMMLAFDFVLRQGLSHVVQAGLNVEHCLWILLLPLLSAPLGSLYIPWSCPGQGGALQPQAGCLLSGASTVSLPSLSSFYFKEVCQLERVQITTLI